jgi:NAD(P)-dependent dehydrogenase (short-subunit alcohol dehydrogenase family)
MFETLPFDSSYRAQPDSCSGRIILVTGAGDGIGRAVSLALAAHGATVILLGRTVRKLEAVYDEIEQAGHPQPAIYPMNLEGAAPKDYEEMAAVFAKEFGRLDGILHNAAFLGALAPIQHQDLELWFRVLQVNLNAPFMLIRACLELLRHSKDASVVFTADRKLGAYWGAYGVSKHAMLGLATILADELDTDNSRVRVNAVDPGPVRTDLRVRAYPGELRKRLLSPESAVAPFVYLLGRDAGGVTAKLFTLQE